MCKGLIATLGEGVYHSNHLRRDAWKGVYHSNHLRRDAWKGVYRYNHLRRDAWKGVYHSNHLRRDAWKGVYRSNRLIKTTGGAFGMDGFSRRPTGASLRRFLPCACNGDISACCQIAFIISKILRILTKGVHHSNHFAEPPVRASMVPILYVETPGKASTIPIIL